MIAQNIRSSDAQLSQYLHIIASIICNKNIVKQVGILIIKSHVSLITAVISGTRPLVIKIFGSGTHNLDSMCKLLLSMVCNKNVVKKAGISIIKLLVPLITNSAKSAISETMPLLLKIFGVLTHNFDSMCILLLSMVCN